MIDTKTWKCEDCGYPLGVIEYHSSVPSLRLEGIVIIGEAEMMCDCGHVQKWHPNSVALSYLFRQRKIRQSEIRKKIETIARG
mgnify:CR=1 FL=1